MRKIGRKNKKTKKEHKPDLSGELLMDNALKRIAKLNGKSATHSSSNTFDAILSKKTISKVHLLTDLPQRDEKTPSEARVPISDDEMVSSQKDYLDFKVDKEILNFEKKLIKEISEGKSSIQKWGIGLVVAAILASAGIMVAMQLFSTQQIKDFINTSFTEKFDNAINETNNNLMLLEKEQNDIKKTIDGLKNKNAQKP
jgi:hypothetical protein